MNLTRADYDHARSLLNQGRIAEMYRYLADRGDRYAELAAGVAAGDSFNGLMALEHMERIAAEQGDWSAADTEHVRELLADRYLDWMFDAFGTDLTLTEEISGADAWAFHQDVFNEVGIGADAWTRYRPPA